MGKQIKRRNMTEVVRDTMLDVARHGQWLSVEEIAKLTGYHECSLHSTISQIRREGTYRVRKRHRDVQVENRGTIWEYTLEQRL